ncbi:hypothetical protein D3C71_1803080 [compost metagenome]
MQLSTGLTPNDGAARSDRVLDSSAGTRIHMTKPRPVFSLNRRCSAAIRRIATFVDQRVDAERSRITSEFQELRRLHGLPSISRPEQEPAP